MRFSERMGLTPVRSVLQIDDIDAGLRNKLWNVTRPRLHSTAYDDYDADFLGNDNGIESLFFELWHDFFKLPSDNIGTSYSRPLATVRKHFLECEWHTVYDLIQFLADSDLGYGTSDSYNRRGYSSRSAFITACNEVLKQELSGYRFVSGKLVQITGEDEVAAIEQALGLPDPLKPVTTHLRQALTLLADRKTPDYRNSIKESILAVESLCKLLSGLPTATLGPALKAVEKSTALHPALKEAFGNLYGYTSDADGIRHALLDEPTLDLEDAKFMLVSCSAFVNYMVIKAQKAGITL